MGLSNKLSCESGSSSHSYNPPLVFSIRDFEALFLGAGTLGCTVYVAPQLFLQFICPWMWDCPVCNPPSRWVLQPSALLRVLSTWLPLSAPPTGLDECFFFNSLVVRLPYSLIFCQFWLFFVFKLLLSFFWLCEEAQYVSILAGVLVNVFIHYWHKSFILQTCFCN